MRIPEINDIARAKGLHPGKMKKSELIRAIQTHEQNTPCFGTNESGNCDRTDCLWREDCL